MRERIINSLLLFLVAVFLVSCSARITRYTMVSPVKNTEPVYEDADIRAVISIINSSEYGLEVTNKTASPVSIFWENSAAIRPDGQEEKLSCKVKPDVKIKDLAGVTSIEPGATAIIEAYPASNAFRDKKGLEVLRTLDYCAGKRVKLEGKDIGVRLLMEINRSARRYRLLLKIEG